MTNVIPVIVTHPTTLFRDGLRQVLTGSRFRPVHIAPELDGTSEKHLASIETCVWLIGVEKCVASTNDLVRRVTAATPRVKAVILAADHDPGDVLEALEAGACGFLCQDISCERLIKSLELIVLGETVVRAQFLQMAWSQRAGPIQAHHTLQPQQADVAMPSVTSDEMLAEPEPPNAALAQDTIRGLSKRETFILQALMEGSPNKVIARRLEITEATVKVHLKAILRKLRVSNRTQAAVWARDNLGEVSNTNTVPTVRSISQSFASGSFKRERVDAPNSNGTGPAGVD